MKKAVKIFVLLVLTGFAFMAYKKPTPPTVLSLVKNKCFLANAGSFAGKPSISQWHFSADGTKVHAYYASAIGTSTTSVDCGWVSVSYYSDDILFTASIPSSAGGGTITVSGPYNRTNNTINTRQALVRSGTTTAYTYQMWPDPTCRY